MSDDAPVRLAQRDITFANGSVGEHLEIRTANPRNYHQLVTDVAAAPPVMIDGMLFRPPGARGDVPCVVVVPGSLSVAPSHLAHAEAFTNEGWAAFVLDPFGGRDVRSTVADQTQYSFAASAYDVMRAVVVLGDTPGIDARRIATQGHSRGGSAVMMAAMTTVNSGVLGDRPPVRGVLAAYPWCGHQPLDPSAGGTEVRVLIGDRDGWCSAQQAQGFVQAIRLAGGAASIRIVAGAEHSFDRNEPVHDIPEAAVSPGAPTVYLDADGRMVHPATGEADAAFVDRDLMVYAMKAGYGVRGARIGSSGDQAEVFRTDMLAFHRRALAT